MLQCSHCRLDIALEAAIILDRNPDAPLPFCCKGCMGIYQLILEEGLDSFYSRRKGWQSGPPVEITIDHTLFTDLVPPLDQGRLSIRLQISGIRCASCIWLIEKAVARIPGIETCRLNYATNQTFITWNPSDTELKTILNTIRNHGYTPLPVDPNQTGRHENLDLLIRFGTSAFLAIQLMIYSMALYAG